MIQFLTTYNFSLDFKGKSVYILADENYIEILDSTMTDYLNNIKNLFNQFTSKNNKNSYVLKTVSLNPYFNETVFSELLTVILDTGSKLFKDSVLDFCDPNINGTIYKIKISKENGANISVFKLNEINIEKDNLFTSFIDCNPIIIPYYYIIKIINTEKGYNFLCSDKLIIVNDPKNEFINRDITKFRITNLIDQEKLYNFLCNLDNVISYKALNSTVIYNFIGISSILLNTENKKKFYYFKMQNDPKNNYLKSCASNTLELLLFYVWHYYDVLIDRSSIKDEYELKLDDIIEIYDDYINNKEKNLIKNKPSKYTEEGWIWNLTNYIINAMRNNIEINENSKKILFKEILKRNYRNIKIYYEKFGLTKEELKKIQKQKLIKALGENFWNEINGITNIHPLKKIINDDFFSNNEIFSRKNFTNEKKAKIKSYIMMLNFTTDQEVLDILAETFLEVQRCSIWLEIDCKKLIYNNFESTIKLFIESIIKALKNIKNKGTRAARIKHMMNINNYLERRVPENKDYYNIYSDIIECIKNDEILKYDINKILLKETI